MSEKFGLDWKEYEHARMEHFMEVIRLEADRDRKAQKKSDGKNKFRPRM